MAFIYGTIDFPTSTQSRELIDILKDPMYIYPPNDLQYFDLNQDTEIKPALLSYSKYRVTPQLFIDGKLVGCIDIISELHNQKKLGALLERVEEKKSPSSPNKFGDKLRKMATLAREP